MATGKELAAGDIRVGGRNGQVLPVGSVAKARHIEALAETGKYGPVDLPEEAPCSEATEAFAQYRRDIEKVATGAATMRTRGRRSPTRHGYRRDAPCAGVDASRILAPVRRNCVNPTRDDPDGAGPGSTVSRQRVRTRPLRCRSVGRRSFSRSGLSLPDGTKP